MLFEIGKLRRYAMVFTIKNPTPSNNQNKMPILTIRLTSRILNFTINAPFDCLGNIKSTLNQLTTVNKPLSNYNSKSCFSLN